MTPNRSPSTARRALLGPLLGLIAATALSGPAAAQGSYPARPIRMVIPLAAGSAVDVAARQLVQKMSQSMGQPFVVENITGASGAIGAMQVVRAAPDGYTIGGFNDSILTMVPNLSANVGFDPLKDFAYVTIPANIEFSVAVATGSRFRTVADLIAAAKAAPGRITYASGGNGRPQHLGGALFAAHFQEGRDIGDKDTLADIAATCGERRDSVREWLDSSADTDKVQRMVAGVRKQGIEGVPFYILNRKLAVSGAQSTAVLGAALLQSLETGKPS